MSEKYGFVYIWRDRKHNRYYIGCRWGSVDDGYVCSSSWMKQAYKKRPQDFKRKILSIHATRDDTILEENRLLSKISIKELGKKYYNLKNHEFNHWSIDGESRATIGEKIANAWTPERREAQANRMKNNNPNNKEGVVEKRLKTIEKNGGLVAWNKGIPSTEEARQKRVETIMRNGGFKPSPNKGIPMSEEQKAKLSASWEITHPDGRVEVINNMVKFCNDNNLSENAMRRVGRGERNHYKNYKVKKIDD